MIKDTQCLIFKMSDCDAYWKQVEVTKSKRAAKWFDMERFDLKLNDPEIKKL